MTECDIFIDTNQVLHFKRIDQVDWCALTGCERCVIIVTPILLRELEQKKIFSPSAVIKDRAGRMIDFLVKQIERPDPIELRDNVLLVFAEREPSIDFSDHGLVREVNDDHYIASALERQSSTGKRTFIVSNDGGMALKLRSRPIDVLRLPKTLALPEDVGAERKELRELRAEVARQKVQRPKLSLRFADGGAKLELHTRRTSVLREPSLAEVIAHHPKMTLPSEHGGQRFPGDLSSLARIGGSMGLSNPERIARYNEGLEAFYAKYEHYLDELRVWTEVSRLTADCAFLLDNDGSATATNIDVTLRFPPSIWVRRVRDRPARPKAPEPPPKPSSVVAAMVRAFQPSDLYPSYAFGHLDLHEGAPLIDEDDTHAVIFTAASLKQKCQFDFDAVLLTRDPDLAGKGIEIEAVITYHEGEPVRHTLAMTFHETDDPETSDATPAAKT